MSIKSGRYIITHAQHWNLAFLSDANDGTSLLACLEQDVPGEEWNVKELRNGRYSIVNFGHRMSASAVFQAQKGEHVVGRERGSIWLIREHDSGGKYTIATANDKLRWWLDDSLPDTPVRNVTSQWTAYFLPPAASWKITLHDAPSSDPRCHWTFQKIGRVNAMPYDAAIEEAAAIRAELARKTSELEGVRGELEKAKVAAVENAARRQEAESKASRKAAEVEVAKREVAQVKAKAAEDAARREEEEITASRKAAEVENAQREAAQAKDEVEKHKSSLRSYFKMMSELYQDAVITIWNYEQLRPNQAALFWAAENGDDAVLPLILEPKGVDVNSKNQHDWTALFFAATNGHDAVVRVLLAQEGVDADFKNYHGFTALFLAAGNGHDAVVRVLLAQQGVDVNSKETGGRTPLYLAVQNGHNAVVRLLLGKEGVDVNARGNRGKTPLMLAEEKNHEEIAQLLREKIASMAIQRNPS